MKYLQTHHMPLPLKGELHRKIKFHIYARVWAGYIIVSGVVKVFPVNSFWLTRKSTRNDVP